jgi:hydroxysqualene dehydroxylase
MGEGPGRGTQPDRHEIVTDQRVIVIGGGLAGITAALDCARVGAEVTLLESRGRLGGAAYSFQRDGLWIDNGQHVFLRCCTEYQRLVHELDADELVTVQPRLEIAVLAPGGRRGRLHRTALPAPLHLAGALARYPYLNVRERVALTAAMTALRFVDPDDPANDRRSFGDWLRHWRQGRRAIDAIWDLIVRPTINLTSEEASLAQAALVFRLGLLERTDAGDIGHAVVPLGRIHDVAGREALARAGVDVRLRTAAAAIVPDADGFAVRLADGDGLRAGHVVVAVPHGRAGALLPDGARADQDSWQRLGSSPIVNVHVVYDRPVLELPFAAGIDSPVQWVFDRTASSGLTDGQYLVVTLSAADAELGMSGEQLCERYLAALAELLPAAAGATVRSCFVTRDHAATFRAAPGQRALRPGPTTALAGLVLAGSWTDTGWPATMEGAVRSGHAASERIIRRLTDPGQGQSSAADPGAGQSSAADSDPGPGQVTVLTPMALEAIAVRRGAPWADVRRTGIGARRAAQYARTHDHSDAAAIVIAGFCGALDPSFEPGDVVLASELRGPEDTVTCADPSILAAVLRRGGLRVHVAPIASERNLVTGGRRQRLAQSGAAAVDLESAWLAPSAGGRPLHALRVVLDTPSRELRNPVTSATGTVAAYRSLRRAASLLGDWALMLADRELVIAAAEDPRGDVPDPEHVAHLTQATRSIDETAAVVSALRERSLAAVGPASEDIGYATDDRQTAVRALAERCDLLLVVGSEHSSDSRRLVDVAHQAGCRSLLVRDASELNVDVLQRARRVGISAGAPAPEELVSQVVAALAGLGAATVSRQSVAEEEIRFKLPPEVRQRRSN